MHGVTGNDTIFQQAIAKNIDYNTSIRDLLQADHAMDEETLYQSLTIQDAQIATDILESVYFSSGGKDGLVSLKVSPHFAFDTHITFETARYM